MVWYAWRFTRDREMRYDREKRVEEEKDCMKLYECYEWLYFRIVKSLRIKYPGLSKIILKSSLEKLIIVSSSLVRADIDKIRRV